MTEPKTLMTGIGLGESPRWHDGRLWFADWVAQELIALDPDGASEVITTVRSLPFSIDWLPDGRLLIIERAARCCGMEPDGSLVTHAELGDLSEHGWNEIVVDGRGHTYVNNICFDFMAGARVRAGHHRAGDRRRRRPAGGGRPRVPQRHGRDARRLDADRRRVLRRPAVGVRHRRRRQLSNRRVWAELGEGARRDLPRRRGRGLDAGPIKRCLRVARGRRGAASGSSSTASASPACSAATDGRTLFMLAADWSGTENIGKGPPTGKVLTVRAPAPGAGRP